MIRTVIVDDEPLAREVLRVRLAREGDIAIVGEANDGPAAVKLILAERPELVFLDVQIPGKDGFEVLRRVSEVCLPQVIFVTAFDQHAVRAFEVHALDYLLKPVTEERLVDALRRARSALALGERNAHPQRIGGLLDARSVAGGGAAPFLERIAVPNQGSFVLVRLVDVEWIGAASNYIELHAGPRTWLVRMTLQSLEQRLDPRRFVRIHRSTIVNVDSVREITPIAHGDYEVLLSDRRRLSLSRTYRDRLLP